MKTKLLMIFKITNIIGQKKENDNKTDKTIGKKKKKKKTVFVDVKNKNGRVL